MHVGDVVIRLAKPEELKDVQRLSQELFVAEQHRDQLLNMNWTFEDGEKYFRDLIDGTKGVCYIAETGGKIVGYLAGAFVDSYSYRPVKMAELDNMTVTEAYRSQGIGEQLIGAFRAWCVEQGVERIKVDAYASNDRAIKFYQKSGFAPYSTILEMDPRDR